MAFYLSPVLNEQQFDANGNPLAGGLIYTYLAGTTTPVTTYKTSTGTAQTNPIALDASGNYPTGTQLWLDGGKSYKFVIQTSTGVTIRTIDNISPINDVIATPDEWVQYTASAFTYLSATSFSIVGDQTNLFQPGRRVRTTNTGGTVYSTIATATYLAPSTTITLTNDSGSLDSGLSEVYYSILAFNNPSLPKLNATYWQMATNRLLGRTTAGTGAVQEITIGNGLTFAGGSLSAVSQPQIQPISASVAANALTISASSLSLDFRSNTLGSGTVTTVTGTPSNLVISSGSTLGTINGTQSDIAVLAINNAGTIELAAVNVAGGVDLSETGLISTTAEGGAGAADSATVIYSTTARSNVAYRVLGYIRSTQATAGTWATAPSLIQGSGGQAITSLMSLGYGQTWQSVIGSRAVATTYYNTTGKPIMVSVSLTPNGVAGTNTLSVGGVVVASHYQNTTNFLGLPLTAIVPPGASYILNNGAAVTIQYWAELR